MLRRGPHPGGGKGCSQYGYRCVRRKMRDLACRGFSRAEDKSLFLPPLLVTGIQWHGGRRCRRDRERDQRHRALRWPERIRYTFRKSEHVRDRCLSQYYCRTPVFRKYQLFFYVIICRCLLLETSLSSLQGKSYTMIGSGPPGGAQKGILARSLTRLFSAIKTVRGHHVSVRISFLGIYCETLKVKEIEIHSEDGARARVD